MALQEFHTLLYPNVLTDAYAQRQGDRKYMLTDYYWLNPSNLDDDEFEMIFFPAYMTPAQFNPAGAEAHIVDPAKGIDRKCGINIQFNKIKIPGDAFLALREPDSPTLQKKGITSLTKVLDDFGEAHNISKELVLSRTLSQGVFYLNGAGQILESSTGAVVTANFGVPSGNQGNVNGIIDLLWSDPDANIPYHLKQIDFQAQSLNAEIPTEIWLHPLAFNGLLQNNLFQEWAAFNQKVTDVVLTGNIIQGLWGKNWHFYGGMYQGMDGAMHPYIQTTGAGSCFMTPPPTSKVMRPINGKSQRPVNLEIVGDIQAALNGLEDVYGRYAYCKLSHDPIALYLYMGDKFGLYFADPNAIFQPTVF